jgi:hypothetical protein
MEAGFKKYYSSHPMADLVLMEPDRGDEEMFFTNIFSYSDRKALCEHAFQETRKDLYTHRATLAPILEKHGMSLRLGLLSDKTHTLEKSIGEGHASHAPVVRNLCNVLDELDSLVN